MAPHTVSPLLTYHRFSFLVKLSNFVPSKYGSRTSVEKFSGTTPNLVQPGSQNRFLGQVLKSSKPRILSGNWRLANSLIPGIGLLDNVSPEMSEAAAAETSLLPSPAFVPLPAVAVGCSASLSLPKRGRLG